MAFATTSTDGLHELCMERTAQPPAHGRRGIGTRRCAVPGSAQFDPPLALGITCAAANGLKNTENFRLHRKQQFKDLHVGYLPCLAEEVSCQKLNEAKKVKLSPPIIIFL